MSRWNVSATALLMLPNLGGCYASHTRESEVLEVRAAPPPFFTGEGLFVALSDDGRWLVYLEDPGASVTSHLVDLETGEDVILDLPGWAERTGVVDLSGDATTLLVATNMSAAHDPDSPDAYSVMDRATRIETPIALDTSDTRDWYVQPHLSNDGARIASLRCVAPHPVPYGCTAEPTIFDWRVGELVRLGGERALTSVGGISFSGDGTAIAYSSRMSGAQSSFFVQRGAGGTYTNTMEGALHPRLSDDGRVIATLVPCDETDRATCGESRWDLVMWRDGARAETFAQLAPVALSGDATMVLVQTIDSLARLDLATGTLETFPNAEHPDPVLSDPRQQMSRDGNTVVIGRFQEWFEVFRW